MTTKDEGGVVERYGLVEVGSFADLKEAQEYALVVLAMNLDCLIQISEGGYVICTEPGFEMAVREEFRLYAEEQADFQPPVSVPIFRSGVEWALVWLVALFYTFAWQHENPVEQVRYYNSSIAVVEGGEVYRAFTALFLHADWEHLLGNAGLGFLFGIFVANSFGAIRGWLLILLSGFFGNWLNAWLQYPAEFYSLGASTAIFGALGLLVGSGLSAAWQMRSYRRGLRSLAPLIAGLMIFSMNGIGGPGVDTMAHLTGMFSGIGVGLAATYLMNRWPQQRLGV